MEISYHGANCVEIKTKQARVLIDPFDGSFGLPVPKIKDEIVLFSEQQKQVSLGDESFLINTAGEYEVKGLGIQGIAARRHIDAPEEPLRGIMYVVIHDDISLLVTGNIVPEMTDEQREAIGEVTAIIVPVGGHGLTLDAAGAQGIVNNFEPRYVLPIHYDDGTTKFPMPQNGLDKFLHEMGTTESAEVPSLKIKANDLPEIMQVVVLSRT